MLCVGLIELMCMHAMSVVYQIEDLRDLVEAFELGRLGAGER